MTWTMTLIIASTFLCRVDTAGETEGGIEKLHDESATIIFTLILSSTRSSNRRVLFFFFFSFLRLALRS